MNSLPQKMTMNHLPLFSITSKINSLQFFPPSIMSIPLTSQTVVILDKDNQTLSAFGLTMGE